VANSVTFRFSGAEQFVVDLHDWRDGLRDQVQAAAVAAGDAIVSEAQTRLPYKTGNLRHNVKARDESEGDTVMVRARSLAKHSHLVERGTALRRTRRGWSRGRMTGQPIFIPAAITKRADFKRRVLEILRSPAPAVGTGTPTVTGSL
jgi:hypothetical protein